MNTSSKPTMNKNFPVWSNFDKILLKNVFASKTSAVEICDAFNLLASVKRSPGAIYMQLKRNKYKISVELSRQFDKFHPKSSRRGNNKPPITLAENNSNWVQKSEALKIAKISSPMLDILTFGESPTVRKRKIQNDRYRRNEFSVEDLQKYLNSRNQENVRNSVAIMELKTKPLHRYVAPSQTGTVMLHTKPAVSASVVVVPREDESFRKLLAAHTTGKLSAADTLLKLKRLIGSK